MSLVTRFLNFPFDLASENNTRTPMKEIYRQLMANFRFIQQMVLSSTYNVTNLPSSPGSIVLGGPTGGFILLPPLPSIPGYILTINSTGGLDFEPPPTGSGTGITDDDRRIIEALVLELTEIYDLLIGNIGGLINQSLTIYGDVTINGNLTVSGANGITQKSQVFDTVAGTLVYVASSAPSPGCIPSLHLNSLKLYPADFSVSGSSYTLTANPGTGTGNLLVEWF